MPMERGGWITDVLSGGYMGNATKDLEECPRGVDIVRMKALGHIGVNFHAEYYGDTMTWRELSSVGFHCGDAAIVKYPALEAGWTYVYDAVGGQFIVTDASGAVTSERVGNLADLGIVLEILCSHQFKVVYSARFINDAFLIARRKRRNEGADGNGSGGNGGGGNGGSNGGGNGSGSGGNGGGGVWPNDDAMRYPAYVLSYVDQFFNETMPWRCNRVGMAAFDQPKIENNVAQTLHKPATEPEVLRSKSPARAATGDYSDMAIKGASGKTGSIDKNRNAVVDVVMGEMVMIAVFASLMYMSKPVYEPWMLWGLWKWLGSGDAIESAEKIFDLSPRW